MKIQSFSPKNLRNAEDFGFMKRILAVAEGLTDESDAAAVNVFKAAVTAFDDALKDSAARAYTEAIEEADAKTDTAWRGITATAKAQGAVKTARTACDEKYHTLVSYINTMATVKGETAYATAIGNINAIIADAKQTLAARATRSGGTRSSTSGSGSGSSDGSRHH